MKCKLQCLGWCKAPDNIEWLHPVGYYIYLLMPENGAIRQYCEWADSNSRIEDGEYDLPDSLFDYASDYWDKDTEEVVA